MDIAKLTNILEEKCGKIADRLLGEEDLDPTDLEDKDKVRVRQAWRHYLSRLDVTWKYNSSGWSHAAPEGHVAVQDFMTDKGMTTLFIPNELAEKMLVLGDMPIPSKKSPVRNHDGEREPIMRACRNKTQYVGLKTVTSSEDGRRIIFVFNNEESLYYSVATSKWFHSNTEKEMGDSHFNNISWGGPAGPLFIPPPAAPGSRWNEFKPGREGFYEQIAQIATEGWVKTYFTILARWTKHFVQRNLRADREISKRAIKQVNRLDILTGENSMAIESLAKNQYVRQLPVDTICGIAFMQEKILDFKAFKDRGMDAWFCKHVGERAATEYVIADHVQGRVDESRADIGVWLSSYNEASKNGNGEIWQYVWEKYRFAIAFDWRFNVNRLKELTGRGYNIKKIMDYVFHTLPMQGICHSMIHQNWDCIVTLADYAKMQSEMCGSRYDRYPKGLKMSHDIAARNYRVKQSQAFADRFASICAEIKSLEFADKEYSVVMPKDVNDIVNEGAALNHCVASYVSGVVDRSYTIMFLRKTEELDKPLVTVQISADGKKIMQSRGHSNRDLTEEENKFLAKYKKHLEPEEQKEMFEAA